jgi:hypothetical protein
MNSPTEEQMFKELDDAFLTDRFDELLGELTPVQLWQYIERSQHADAVLSYVWTYHVSWSLEATWAWDSSLNDEEKLAYAQKEGRPVEEVFKGVPSNFDPNVKLKNVSPWDRLCRLTAVLGWSK